MGRVRGGGDFHLEWVKKDEITEGRKAGRLSKTKLPYNNYNNNDVLLDLLAQNQRRN